MARRRNGPQNLGRGGMLQGYRPPLGPTNLGRGNLLTNYYPGDPTPPAAPAAPPAVGGAPLDPAYEAYALSAGRNLSLSEGEGAYQRGQLEQTYGYGASGAANPYSRAALLEESYKRSKLGTTNSMASAGQLYSGAYGRQQGENDRNYSIASDANRRAYDTAVHGVNYGQAQNVANYGVGVDNEKYQSILRALGLA